jgi:hypothetical protein
LQGFYFNPSSVSLTAATFPQKGGKAGFGYFIHLACLVFLIQKERGKIHALFVLLSLA